MATSSAGWLLVTKGDGERVAHEGASWSEDGGALVVTDDANGTTEYGVGEWFSVQPSDITPEQWSEQVEQMQADESTKLKKARDADRVEHARQEEREQQRLAAAAAAERALVAKAALERAQAETARLAREAEEAAAAVTDLPAGP